MRFQGHKITDFKVEHEKRMGCAGCWFAEHSQVPCWKEPAQSFALKIFRKHDKTRNYCGHLIAVLKNDEDNEKFLK